MNENPQLEPLKLESPETVAGLQAKSLKGEKSLSDRILAWAFAGSVVVNLVWIALVSHSHLFGGGSAIPPMKEMAIKVFKVHPPRPKATKPKPPPPPPKRKPPPPHQKPLPRVVHHLPPPRPVTHPKPRPVTHPTLHPVAHPTPPHPATHPVQVHNTTNPHTTSKLADKSPTEPNPADKGPTNPGPANSGPASTGSADKGPVDKGPLEQDKPKEDKPKEDKPKVVHPSNWVPIDTQEASFPENIGSDVSTDGIDGGSITNNKVVITFTIDETGHARNVHVKVSCGNTELDNRFADAVRRAHGTPAIQDHIPRDQPDIIPFDVNT